MKHDRKTKTVSALAAASAVLLAGMGPAHSIQPHRAVYDLTLKSAESRSGITSVDGKMVYEIMGSDCEGYAVVFRFLTEITGTDGTVRQTDIRSTSFEEAGGKAFQFASKTFQNQRLSRESRGVATRTDEDLEVRLQKPAEQHFSFGRDVVFPSQHTLEVIRLAKSGEQIYSAGIYDGSDEGDTFYNTMTIIGQPRLVAVDEGDAGEQSVPHWPVVISYFDPRDGQTDSEPIYTMRFLVSEPGVSRDLTMDYIGFTIRGDLSELELLTSPPCE